MLDIPDCADVRSVCEVFRWSLLVYRHLLPGSVVRPVLWSHPIICHIIQSAMLVYIRTHTAKSQY